MNKLLEEIVEKQNQIDKEYVEEIMRMYNFKKGDLPFLTWRRYDYLNSRYLTWVINSNGGTINLRPSYELVKDENFNKIFRKRKFLKLCK